MQCTHAVWERCSHYHRPRMPLKLAEEINQSGTSPRLIARERQGPLPWPGTYNGIVSPVNQGAFEKPVAKR